MDKSATIWSSVYCPWLLWYTDWRNRVMQPLNVWLAGNPLSLLSNDGSGLLTPLEYVPRARWIVWWGWKWYESCAITVSRSQPNLLDILDLHIRQHQNTKWGKSFTMNLQKSSRKKTINMIEHYSVSTWWWSSPLHKNNGPCHLSLTQSYQNMLKKS